MSSINGVGGNNPIQNILNRPIQKQVPTEAPKQTPTDRLELSGGSHFLAALKTNDVRADKVANIKAQLANGTYEDDKKLDIATDKLLDDLLK